jgi:hypothetical protein
MIKKLRKTAMSDALSSAVNGLTAASSRIAKASSSIVNASSTGGNNNIATSAVVIAEAKTSYAAEAKVVTAVKKNNKTLLDILA